MDDLSSHHFAAQVTEMVSANTYMAYRPGVSTDARPLPAPHVKALTTTLIHKINNARAYANTRIKKSTAGQLLFSEFFSENFSVSFCNRFFTMMPSRIIVIDLLCTEKKIFCFDSRHDPIFFLIIK